MPPASRERQTGYCTLGPQISYDREQWQSQWPDVDGWMLNQLRQSPLNVQEEANADIVIVPVLLEIGDLSNPNDLLRAIQVCQCIQVRFRIAVNRASGPDRKPWPASGLPFPPVLQM